MKQEIKFTVDIPEGYEFVRYGEIKKGDYYLSEFNTIEQWRETWELAGGVGLIFKKKTLQLKDVEIGNKFKFKNRETLRNSIFRKIGDSDKCFIIDDDTGHIRDFSLMYSLEEIEIVK